jgi:hypothetical protein
MKAILAVLGSGAMALALIAVVIFIAGDRDVFTSPPEAVAENFVRSLATRRFGPAKRAMPDALKERSIDRLHELSREVARPGALLDVNARELLPREARGERAQVAIRVRRVGGDDLTAMVPLQESSGGWQIGDLAWDFAR